MQYTRKYHLTTADNMSTDWLGPRIYRPSLEEVLRGDNEAALRTVAEAIQRKIGWTSRTTEMRPFLLAYYGDLKLHLERRLLLGNRRADKHSR